MQDSEKKHLLIIGASRGLGASLAEGWSTRYGAALTLSMLARNSDALEHSAANCEKHGGIVRRYLQDIRDLDGTLELVKSIDSERAIDIAVFCAGITGDTRDGLESTEQISAIIDTNLRSISTLASALGESMQNRGEGSLVFINSIAAFRGLPLSPAYCASKAGLKAYADALRGRLEPRGVHVLSVYPGFLNTDMTRAYRGPKPMMKDCDAITGRIIRAVEKRRAVLVYPWVLGIGQKLLNLLPARWGDRILQWMRYG